MLIESGEFLYKGLYNEEREQDEKWTMLKFLMELELENFVKEKI